MLENIGLTKTHIKIRNLHSDIKGFSYMVKKDKSGSGQIEFHPVAKDLIGEKGIIKVGYRSKKESRCSFVSIPPAVAKILSCSIMGKTFINPDGVIIIEVMHMVGVPDNYKLPLEINGVINSIETIRSRVRKPRFSNFMLIIPVETIGSKELIYGEFTSANVDQMEIRICKRMPELNHISFTYLDDERQFTSVKMVSTIRFSVFKTNKIKPSAYKFESFNDNVLKFRRAKINE